MESYRERSHLFIYVTTRPTLVPLRPLLFSESIIGTTSALTASK